jgi:hypothetical protein
MSKMLQEAIIDAEALKEAALRNAEQAIVEKYESDEQAMAMGLSGDLALEEKVDLSEDLLAKIIEELTVDVSPQSDGWNGATSGQVEEAEEQAVAEEQDTEASEENEELRKNVKELEEKLARTNKRFKILKEEKNKIKNITLKMRNHVDSVNLQNAKLLYTNRVLSSASLNERQKIKIAEAISIAKSVDEAKTIFETLQSAVGTSSKKNPKSLSEAVERRTSTLPRVTKTEKAFDPTSERMRILAGISKK